MVTDRHTHRTTLAHAPRVNKYILDTCCAASHSYTTSYLYGSGCNKLSISTQPPSYIASYMPAVQKAIGIHNHLAIVACPASRRYTTAASHNSYMLRIASLTQNYYSYYNINMKDVSGQLKYPFFHLSWMHVQKLILLWACKSGCWTAHYIGSHSHFTASQCAGLLKISA